MPVLLFDKNLMNDLLFGYSDAPISVKSIVDHGDAWRVEIEGPELPQVDNVRAIVTESRNRAGQRFCTMTFEPD